MPFNAFKKLILPLYSKKIFIAIMLCLGLSAVARAQQPQISRHDYFRDSIVHGKQIDVVDLAKFIFQRKHKPMHPKVNVNGPFITAIPYPSYTIATGIAAALPINISFYTNKKEKGELSFFNNVFLFTQYKQIITQSISNVYLHHDKWELIGDWRYYHFPTVTYGLGSMSSFDEPHSIDYSHLRVYELVMRKVAKDISIGLGYHLDYHWNIKDFDAQNGATTDFVLYGLNKSSFSTGPSINFLYDSRDNPNNAMKGYYFSFQVRTNIKALGSSSNWSCATIDVRKYIALPIPNWRAGIALWAYANFTLNGTPPYLDLPNTASDNYNNSGRGYGMGRYRGLHMLYFEWEFRTDILPNGLLGAVAFFNLQTLSEWPSNTFQMVQPGGGIGLRIKLNKRTNTNSCVDYGFGTGGSKGFAFNLNEIF